MVYNIRYRSIDQKRISYSKYHEREIGSNSPLKTARDACVRRDVEIGTATIIMAMAAPGMATTMAMVKATARAMATAKLMATGTARLLQNCLLAQMHKFEYKNCPLIAHSCVTERW